MEGMLASTDRRTWCRFFFVLSLPLVAMATVYWTVAMPCRGTPMLVRLDAGVAWMASLSILLLVPSDVAIALRGGSQALLEVMWPIAYWYAFGAMFSVLPIHQEYADAGDFTAFDKLRTSLRENAIFYGTLGAAGVIGIIMLLITGKLDFTNVVGFCIALSNSFGLMGVLFLMGFGLVDIPRRLWHGGNVEGNRKLSAHRVGLAAARVVAARATLAVDYQVAKSVADEEIGPRDPLRPYIEKVLAEASTVLPDIQDIEAVAPTEKKQRRFWNLFAGDEEDELLLEYYDIGELGKLRKRVRKSVQSFDRERAQFLQTVRNALDLEDIVDNRAAGDRVFRVRGRLNVAEESNAWVTLEWWWKCYLLHHAKRLLAICCCLLSASVFLGEASLKYAGITSFPAFLVREAGGQELYAELACLFFLAYTCTCTYYSLYKMGSFSFYLLVPRHTDGYSLISNAMFMCRFSAPLAFNFLYLVQMSGLSNDTVFYRLIGSKMDRAIPFLGDFFNTWAPTVMIPYVVLLIVGHGVLNRVVSWLTRTERFSFDDDMEEKSGCTESGKRLIQVERENQSQGLPVGLSWETMDRPAPSRRGAGRYSIHVGDEDERSQSLLGSWMQKVMRKVPGVSQESRPPPPDTRRMRSSSSPRTHTRRSSRTTSAVDPPSIVAPTADPDSRVTELDRIFANLSTSSKTSRE